MNHFASEEINEGGNGTIMLESMIVNHRDSTISARKIYNQTISSVSEKSLSGLRILTEKVIFTGRKKYV